MHYTESEVLQFVVENDVKFIRLQFCDIFGAVKNIAIMANELPRAFESGISFDASAVKGFMNIEESDLYLFPDPATLVVLPWRPQQGRVARFFCDVKRANGEPFDGDGRTLLKKAVARAAGQGFVCEIGSECEFYLFELDEKGNPTKRPHDRAGYLDVAPLDRGENVRREICLTLEDMGIRPESSHHEQGPGQNEVDFRHADALSAADHLVTFKTVVKTMANRNGLYASFLPKPLPEFSGNGLHINLSLLHNGVNIFKTGTEEHSQEAESFIAGILQRVKEMTLFLNPLVNSYQRFGSFEAPQYITWSHQNRSQLIRIPAGSGAGARMELRSPDPSCNPYFAFALLIHAGLDGVQQKLPLCKPANLNLYSVDETVAAQYEKLPAALDEALYLAQNSDFIKQHLPVQTAEKFFAVKAQEWESGEGDSVFQMV